MKVLKAEYLKFTIMFEDNKEYNEFIKKYGERIKKEIKKDINEYNEWVIDTYYYDPGFKKENIIVSIIMLEDYNYDKDYFKNGYKFSEGKNITTFKELYDNYYENGYGNNSNIDHVEKMMAGYEKWLIENGSDKKKHKDKSTLCMTMELLIKQSKTDKDFFEKVDNKYYIEVLDLMGGLTEALIENHKFEQATLLMAGKMNKSKRDK